MKFAPFVFDFLTYDSWDCLENVWDYKNPKDYFGFDIPYTREDIEQSEDIFELLQPIAEKWHEENPIEVVDDSMINYDLEKSYAEYRMIFKYNDKYYTFTYIRSPFVGAFEHTGYPSDLPEVKIDYETVTKITYHY